MANVVLFNETTKQALRYLKSVSTTPYTSRPDAVVNPDVSAFANVPIKYWKVVAGVVSEMTQAQKDAVDQAEADALAAADLASIQALDDRIDNVDMDVILTKADNAIDNIGSLADAKVFLKKLCRYIIALHK